MTIWKMPIHIRGNNSSYAEIKDRHVVAGGWSSLGDLSCLYQACRTGKFTWDEVIPILKYLLDKEPHEKLEENFKNTFKNLLFYIKPGDIVISYENLNPVGICQICDCVTYGYDLNGKISGVSPVIYGRSFFEYAHCLYGVKWVDWSDFNAFAAAAPLAGIGINPGNALIAGIMRCNQEVDRIVQDWTNYVTANPDLLLPCSKEIQNRCEEIKAQVPTDCCTQLAYWRSISMHTEIEKALELKKQVIFYGPPGTGKTYLAKEFVKKHWGLPPDQYQIVQFHPSYNYEDFVRGIQVSTVGSAVHYDTVHRVFSGMCKKANDERDKSKKYVLIIDEINRANLASVLGELIYGLEYRGDVIRTPYEVDGTFDLVVPKNLYIIGTMNTADRSIGHIDYAVRRRFAFMPMRPDCEIIKQVVPAGNLQDSALQLFKAVESLFTGDKPALTGDFFADDVQPGHTYFLVESCEELVGNFVYQVLPLLHEYVKDGVLGVGATLKIGGFKQELVKPISPVEAFKEIMKLLPCCNAKNPPETTSPPDAETVINAAGAA